MRINSHFILSVLHIYDHELLSQKPFEENALSRSRSLANEAIRVYASLLKGARCNEHFLQTNYITSINLTLSAETPAASVTASVSF